MAQLAMSEKEKALSQLCIGAIFFAMRSCEYLQSSHKEDSKRTNILRLKNISFKKDGRLLNQDSQHISSADLILITFEFQKKNKRNKTVHMFKTNDNLLCPVKAWASTILRVRKTVPGADGNTKVCAYADHNQTQFIDSTYARAKLRGIVELTGPEILGFTKKDVGLHSIRSGGAMAMFLSGVQTLIIQRVGRWESDAFMEYIREQVESFTEGVSLRKIQNVKFYHLDRNTAKTDTYAEECRHTSTEDGDPILIPHVAHFSNEVQY